MKIQRSVIHCLLMKEEEVSVWGHPLPSQRIHADWRRCTKQELSCHVQTYCKNLGSHTNTLFYLPVDGQCEKKNDR
ncbi:hypothetical protein FKM82_012622 [Ascaphus truei]